MYQDGLNDIQRKIYRFIRTTYLSESRTPSRAEIKAAIHRTGTSSLERDLYVLQDAGFIDITMSTNGKN